MEQPFILSISWTEGEADRSGYVHIMDDDIESCYTYKVPFVDEADEQLMDRLLDQYKQGNLTFFKVVGLEDGKD